MQEDKGRLIDAGEDDHAQVDPECLDGKVGIINALVGRAENGHKLSRQKLHDQQGDDTHCSLAGQQLGKQGLHPGIQPRAHIEAHDGDTASSHTHHDGDDNLEELHDDAHHRHGDLGILLLAEHSIQCAVMTDHVVDGRHGRHQRDLGEEAANAKCQGAAHDSAPQVESLRAELHGFGMTQIPDSKDGGGHLTNDRGHRRAHHAPFAHENENGV